MEGYLRLQKGDDPRWEIVTPDGTHEITSGCAIEVKIGGHWIYTTIEFGPNRYYATTPGVVLFNGLEARKPEG